MLTIRYLALRPLTGEHGMAVAGAEFDVPAYLERKYRRLEQRNIVRRVFESPIKPTDKILEEIAAIVEYDNKVITPKENKKARRK